MDNKKFSDRQFILFAINYIVGFGFIATISGVIDKGLWGILVFGVASFIAFGVALTFARLANEYPNDMGSSYAYAKKAHGRFFTFCQGWNQVLQGPILAAAKPLFMWTILKGIDPNNELLYSILSVALFAGLIIISTLGLRQTKKVIGWTGGVKWGVMGVAFGAAIYFAIKNHEFNFDWLSSDAISVGTISGSILSFMYAFGGIEGVAAVSAESHSKNFRRTLIKAFLFILSFYFIFYIIFIGVGLENFGLKTNDQNIFQEIFNVAMGTTGLVIYIIGMLTNNSSNIISTTITAVRCVVPLAEDRYFPLFLKKKNKNDEYGIGMYILAALTIITMLIFNILPRFVKLEDAFSEVLDIGVITFLIQYLLTIWTLLVLSYKHKIKKVPLWEKIIVIATGVMILLILAFQLVPPIIAESWETLNTIRLVSYIGFTALGFLIWWITVEVRKRAKIQQPQNSQ